MFPLYRLQQLFGKSVSQSQNYNYNLNCACYIWSFPQMLDVRKLKWLWCIMCKSAQYTLRIWVYLPNALWENLWICCCGCTQLVISRSFSEGTWTSWPPFGWSSFMERDMHWPILVHAICWGTLFPADSGCFSDLIAT